VLRLAAGLTQKHGLRWAIGFLAMTTNRAGAARVAGINREERHACKPRLVLKEHRDEQDQNDLRDSAVDIFFMTGLIEG
jgi:hypothetical protein